MNLRVRRPYFLQKMDRSYYNNNKLKFIVDPKDLVKIKYIPKLPCLRDVHQDPGAIKLQGCASKPPKKRPPKSLFHQPKRPGARPDLNGMLPARAFQKRRPFPKTSKRLSKTSNRSGRCMPPKKIISYPTSRTDTRKRRSKECLTEPSVPWPVFSDW